MRICLIPIQGSTLPDPDALTRATALGFDHVLLSGLSVLTTPTASVIELVRQCRSAGLQCLLDLALDRYPDPGFGAAHAASARIDIPALDPGWVLSGQPHDWGAHTEDSDAHHPGARLHWQRAPVAAALVSWWAERLRGLASAGVAGYCCLAPARVPGHRWAELTAAVRRDAGGQPVRFIAWTPGVAAQALPDLLQGGFDAAVCSLPWWDYRSPWLVEEMARLRDFGQIVAAPSLQPGGHDALAARRALWAAAALGDSLLVPARFEIAGEMVEQQAPPYDLTHELMHANAWQAARGDRPARAIRQPSGPDADVTVLLRIDDVSAGTDGVEYDTAGSTLGRPMPIALNPSVVEPASLSLHRILSALPDGTGQLEAADGGPGGGIAPGMRLDAMDALALAPAGILILSPVATEGESRQGRVFGAAVRAELRRSVEQALGAPRVAIEHVEPSCDGGRFAVRRTAGERIEVSADIWMDGHDKLAAVLLWRGPGDKAWQESPLLPTVNDRWVGQFPLTGLGRHWFTVEAWRDTFGSWCDEVTKKLQAGVDVTLETEEGARLVAAVQPGESTRHGHEDDAAALPAIQAALKAATGNDARRLELLLAPATRAAMQATDPRLFASRHPVDMPVEADRLAGRFASWYELFPRSESADPRRHGTFDDVIRRLPAIRAMGFDVLYFPPIHPIGTAHRKGRNNSLKAAPDDPGSPYAIGSPDGGHDAIHPELGTIDDFRRLRDAAATHGLELALDFAIQCSPDHPWLRDHPEWFAHRPDGSLRYAENPPKKYEDIVNVDFYANQHGSALWKALRDVVRFWVEEGVRIFRVDNPHTKPLPFWEWLIADIRDTHPDTLFLAEAFTRPKMMARLAKLGFSQSYTYFTWRNNKRELTEYMTELTQSPLRDFFRPHFFVNTPDINPYFLHNSGRAGFLIRAALATMLSGLWGMYNGFEVCEGAPLIKDGVPREEYLDSEKYQFRQRDWSQPGNIVAEISRLNMIRQAHPALQDHLGLRFYHADDDSVLYFARFLRGEGSPGTGMPGTSGLSPGLGSDVLLIAISLDPHAVRESGIELPLWEWGLPDHGALAVEDLMQGHRFTWEGKHQRVRLDPQALPFAIWHVKPIIEVGR